MSHTLDNIAGGVVDSGACPAPRPVKSYACSIPHDMRCPHTIAEMRPWFCEGCTQGEAESRYVIMNNAYRDGKPLCSDEDFDRYEAFVRRRHPTSATFHKVGII